MSTSMMTVAYVMSTLYLFFLKTLFAHSNSMLISMITNSWKNLQIDVQRKNRFFTHNSFSIPTYNSIPTWNIFTILFSIEVWYIFIVRNVIPVLSVVFKLFNNLVFLLFQSFRDFPQNTMRRTTDAKLHINRLSSLTNSLRMRIVCSVSLISFFLQAEILFHTSIYSGSIHSFDVLNIIFRLLITRLSFGSLCHLFNSQCYCMLRVYPRMILNFIYFNSLHWVFLQHLA